MELTDSVGPVVELPVKWTSPRKGWFKINVDSAIFSKQKSARIGVLIRDELGRVEAALKKKLSLTAWICFFGAIGNAIVALAIEKDKAAWAIHRDVKLLAVLYGGIGSTGLASYIQACILKDKGPVFVTAFALISMIMVVVLSSWLLAEKMYMGRIVGDVIIIVGIYVLIWRKGKEESTCENSGTN
ncbi:WAT1-related protein At2g39510 [Quercus suber]|uniref:WAT1-related protein At2g39510 n=1 Tax=Quercus suber TaxID=58331 RepID=UPI000CE1BA41|nr:WAT1-related protein At2g39510-like [Quercus suber]